MGACQVLERTERCGKSGMAEPVGGIDVEECAPWFADVGNRPPVHFVAAQVEAIRRKIVQPDSRVSRRPRQH